MNCTFFGNKDTPSRVKNDLKDTIKRLINEKGVVRFYVGNNGNFDLFVQNVLSDLKKERIDIDYAIVLSSIREIAIDGDQEATIFPEELETVPPRFAISRRNDWMIKNSDYLIAYAKHPFSNSRKWVERATKKGLKIINLAEEESVSHPK